MANSYYVYILANRGKMLYTGVTNDLHRRVWQHRNDDESQYASKHGIHDLVWFDETDDVTAAILKEKQIKNWRRQWKINLIEEKNNFWEDLARGWYE
jgi:putative endonuclease